ncbi:IS1182 family transposase [Tolypothrix campylonemoides VB511288]|nr:IS1182 family transposase [Tolypothrix campylonemoides VB511288]
MRPPYWNPQIELSQAEQSIISKIKKAKLFIFLRHNRHHLFDEEFQAELTIMFKDSTVGYCPVSPAQLALALILQAYTGVSDDEVIEALVMDRRWQLVLDCHDCQKPPFSKGTLVNFRQAMIEFGVDHRLIERTVEIAKERGGFGSSNLRAALDSSPLWGAARVEDTYNLLGHALRKAVRLMAQACEQTIAEIAQETQIDNVVTETSLKAALDLNWDDPTERSYALEVILSALNNIESHVEKKTANQQLSPVVETLQVARQIQSQDVTIDSQGQPILNKGVAKHRRISIEDSQMRHGRKSRSQRFNGYKRHVLRDLDMGIVRAVGITAANVPESEVTEAIDSDLKAQNVKMVELHIDRAYLPSHWVKQRSQDLTIFCKAWPVRNGDRFTKTDFVLDWEHSLIRCPNNVTIPFEQGKTVHFPASECHVCPIYERCTTSARGRSISIHPDEAFMQELRQRQDTESGRAKLRERSQVEHTLAHLGQWQGDRARYLGARKNLFDLRRVAVIHNLHVIARMSPPAFSQQVS